ncbi:MAG TPA: MarR family transcriptional regulator [Verrucomicrobiales bacterium]|nr:MarR family transcriptional regulator [Verrucomicrobiales bacterium]
MPAASKSSEAQTPIDSPERHRLPVLLRRAWYGLNQAFRRRIQHTGLTPDQFTVLRNLQEAGATGLNQSQLTERMSSDPNTIASLVDRMNKAGVLDRQPDPNDRRAYILRINAMGRKKYAEARRIAIDLQSSVMASVPDAEQARLLEQLSTVADACFEAAEKSPRK